MSKEPPKLLHIETSDTQLSFPPSHHLIVTTRKNVFSWNSRGLSDLFHSGSEGIVAAKKAKDGSGMLAVADSQVVVLHDVRRGMERSYRLKGADGHVRLLKYTNDSKSLFFTTSLQNSVQSYSLKQSCLLGPSHEHPSPPTCLALSPTSHLLLSCSASPPTIYLQNLTLRTSPLNMRPSISSAAVTVASFHPGRPNIFLLAFADGVLAIYDATKLLRDGGKGGKKAGTVWCSTDGEIAHVSSVHTPGNTTALARPGESMDAATLGRFGEDIQAGGVGLTAAEFVPGFRARVISVGADGKCALVDFEVEGKKTGVMLRTWHVRAPATSLSILQVDDTLANRKNGDGTTQKRREISVGASKRGGKGLGPYLVAIGRVDGKVVVINLGGELLGEKTVDPDGGQVVGVEWAIEPADGNHSKDKGIIVSAKYRNKKLPPSIPARHLENRVPLGRRKRKSMSSILAAGRDTEEEVLPGHDDTRGLEKVRSPCNVAEATAKTEDEFTVERGPLGRSVWQDVVEPSAPDYMNLFSPVRQKARRRSSQAATLPLAKERKSGTPRIEELLTSEEGDARSAVSAPLFIAGEGSPKKPGYSSVSQGITPGKTRRAPARNTVSYASQQPSKSPTSVIEEDWKLLAEMRSVRGNGTDVGGSGFALFAPYMLKKVVKEPADSPTLQHSEELPVLEGSPDPVGDIWLTDTSGNERKGSRKGRKASQKSSESTSSTNTRNRKTVSFRPPINTGCDRQAWHAKRSPQKFLIHGNTPEPVKRQPGPVLRSSEFHRISIHNPRESIQNGTPLAEVNHNFCSPSKRHHNRTPKLRSSRATTPVGFPKNNPQPHCCSSHSHLHEEVAKLHEEMRSFQAKMIREFQGQKRWFEEIVAGERKASEAVREENERLRRELFEGVRAEIGLGDRRE